MVWGWLEDGRALRTVSGPQPADCEVAKSVPVCLLTCRRCSPYGTLLAPPRKEAPMCCTTQ